MKEYLITNALGKFYYTKTETPPPNMFCEIPDGADFFTCLDTSEEEVLIFWKEGYKKCLCCDEDWVSGQPPMSNYIDGYNAKIIWRREKTVEYLDPSDWSLKVVGENSKISGDWILVPKGADTLAGHINSDSCRYFWNHTDNLIIGCGESLSRYPDWENTNGVTAFSWVGDEDVSGVGILWTRHTQPEELPFIDNEPEYRELDQLILENSEPVAIPKSWLKDDAVNHPTHYTTHPSGIECIEITRHHDFAIGNAIKYLWRAGLKDSDNEVQDLKKAIWYIQDKINQLEKSNGGNN